MSGYDDARPTLNDTAVVLVAVDDDEDEIFFFHFNQRRKVRRRRRSKKNVVTCGLEVEAIPQDFSSFVFCKEDGEEGKAMMSQL